MQALIDRERALIEDNSEDRSHRFLRLRGGLLHLSGLT